MIQVNKVVMATVNQASIISKKAIAFSVVILLATICDAQNPKPPIKTQLIDMNDEGGYYKDSHDSIGGYLSDWSDQEWVKLSGRIQQPKCIDIPSNLTLCHGIGYDKMMLPNLLDHDSMIEVTQQAFSWVPLTRINCHPDAKMFLCSLFSPVCLERLIYPCRSLCDSVRSSCVARMKNYGFDWPDMLKCDKFPLDNDMCIKLIHDIKPDNNCTVCKHPLTHESLIDQYCRSDVAMRVSIKDFRNVNGHKELVLRKKRTLFKHQGLTKSQTRNMTLFIEGGSSCSCENINSLQDRYLIMANKKGDQLMVSFGIVWERKDKEFRKGITTIRKGNTCEGIFDEISANGVDSKSTNSGKAEKSKKTENNNNLHKQEHKSANESTKDNNKNKDKQRKNGKKGKKEKDKKGNKDKNKKGNTSTPKTTSRPRTGSTQEREKPGTGRLKSGSKTNVENKGLKNLNKAFN